LGADVNVKTSDEIHQWEQIRKFVSLASKVKIKVFILISCNQNNNTFWLEPSHSSFNTFMVNYKAYQTSASNDQKFSGLHLDFENYEIDGGSDTAITNALQDLTNFLVYVRDNQGSVFETIDLDVSCWVGNGYSVIHRGSQKIFAKAVFAETDRVFTMGYSNTGKGTYTNANSDGWLNTSNNLNNINNIPVMFGAETEEIPNHPGNTYFGSGKKALYIEMNDLREKTDLVPMDSNKTGLSIHYNETWMNLQTGV